MKKFVVLIPKRMLQSFVDYTFQNEIRIITTVEKEASFFDLSEPKVECYCACKEEQTVLIAASEWKDFIKN